jgi:hypothetical protein
MRSPAPLLLTTLLAACSGGGERPFTPSADLPTTHAYLLGGWGGTLRDLDTGTVYDVTAQVRPGPHTGRFELDVQIQTLGTGTGELQADGDHWRASLTPSPWGEVRADGPIVGRRTLRASWTAPASSSVRAGALTLSQLVSASPVWTQEIHELDGLTLIVQRSWR